MSSEIEYVKKSFDELKEIVMNKSGQNGSGFETLDKSTPKKSKMTKGLKLKKRLKKRSRC